jgi:anti-anti-sigma factor
MGAVGEIVVCRWDARPPGWPAWVMEPPGESSVVVWVGPAGSDGQYGAVVALFGEHDVSTCREVARALAPIRGDVLVDLMECSFMDSTILSAILQKARMLRIQGHGLEVRSRPGSPVARMLEIASIFDVINVRQATRSSNGSS